MAALPWRHLYFSVYWQRQTYYFNQHFNQHSGKCLENLLRLIILFDYRERIWVKMYFEKVSPAYDCIIEIIHFICERPGSYRIIYFLLFLCKYDAVNNCWFSIVTSLSTQLIAPTHFNCFLIKPGNSIEFQIFWHGSVCTWYEIQCSWLWIKQEHWEDNSTLNTPLFVPSDSHRRIDNMLTFFWYVHLLSWWTFF